jgi:DNA-binding CsgD family transcriptional regulator
MILALRADDPSVLEVHRPQMETWMAADSAEAVARLGASVMYFEPWRTDWMEATGLETDQIWPHLTSLSPHLLPVLNPERVHDTPVQRAETAYRSASWLLLIIGLLPLLGLMIFKQVHQSRSLYSNHQLISDIDRVYRNPKLMGRMSGALSRAVWLGRQALKAVPDGLLEQLTTREREILKAAQINERPKLTADRLGIAPKSIYTLEPRCDRSSTFPGNSAWKIGRNNTSSKNHEKGRSPRRYSEHRRLDFSSRTSRLGRRVPASDLRRIVWTGTE